MRRLILIAATVLVPTLAQAASVTLYDQDFEAPNTPPGFINGAGSGYKDLSQQTVSSLYDGQPAGFTFAQTFTVETMLIGGNQAFGTGYSDPAGTGGSYAIGMLGSRQDDRLGLGFDIGTFDFFNFRVDLSSVGLDGLGGPFASASDVPIMRFTLFDNPGGSVSIGSGTILDQAELTGTASALDALDWTTGTFAFDTTGNTDGNVVLQMDLIQGGYAAFDNMLITASDTAGGGLPPVPVPPAALLLATGLAAVFGLRGRRSAPR